MRAAHLTTDQINSEFPVSIADDVGVVNAAETCEYPAQGVRKWGQRRRLRKVAAVQLRSPSCVPDDSQLRRASATMSRRIDAGINLRHSPAEHLVASAREDISRLNQILCTQRCNVVMRGLNGIRTNDASTLSTPIVDAEGRALASLDIFQSDATRSESSAQLLGALAEATVRTITERWFRLVHRREWVLAAIRRNAPGKALLVAIDRDQRIVGADRQARQLLEERGQRMGPHLTISALFRPNATLVRRRSYCDVSTTLFASSNGEPWIALITPPDTGAMESHQDPRVLLHVRPRLDSLTHMSSLQSVGRTKRGLSQGALKRIEEHIESHLDSALDVEELAAIVRMSSSHFTRSFHKSVGLTPHRYVIRNRVMRARELLATTKMPLTEIALTTGFSDQSHFSRRFHEIVGIPPGAFRGHDDCLSP
jgi:AraC-like DNA-binding protein